MLNVSWWKVLRCGVTVSQDNPLLSSGEMQSSSDGSLKNSGIVSLGLAVSESSTDVKN